MHLDRRRFLEFSGSASASFLASRNLFAEDRISGACTAIVEAYVRDQRFQGVVALGRRGRPVYWKTVGFANFEKQERMSQASVFGIASISKMLTTVSVLRLQEQGQLKLDTPISAYLPYFRKKLGDRLTLRFLLANDSGVPNLFASAMKADPKTIEARLTTEEAVHRFAEGDLIFDPGERFDYSLSNWILVLAIVEAVTRQDYASAMGRLLLVPLGLNDTTAVLDTQAVQSYDNSTPPMKRTQPRQPYIAAAGGYFSNATDLMSAAHQIFDTGFLTTESKRELTTIEVTSDHYALGGRIREVEIGSQKVRAAWDTGNALGYRSVLGYRLDGKATVVVLNNTSMSQKTLDVFSDALLAAFG